MKQLGIEGIGQQKAKLSDWKKKSNVFTYCSPHMGKDDQWSCWDETDDPSEFWGKYGDNGFAIGSSEKEVIIKFCTDNEIALPFWY